VVNYESVIYIYIYMPYAVFCLRLDRIGDFFFLGLFLNDYVVLVKELNVVIFQCVS
jgi:hypothetical protein